MSTLKAYCKIILYTFNVPSVMKSMAVLWWCMFLMNLMAAVIHSVLFNAPTHQAGQAGPVVFLWMLLWTYCHDVNWLTSFICKMFVNACTLSTYWFTNTFYKWCTLYLRIYCTVACEKHLNLSYLSKESQFVLFISSSFVQVEKRSFFLLQVESIVNIGLFLNFLFSLKSITGFFRRSDAITSKKAHCILGM